MNNLEDHIEAITTAPTAEEAFERFCSIMESHGYDRISYSLVTDHPSLELPKQHGLSTSYPEDWMKHYGEHNYMAIDPVTQRVLDTRKPFFWSDITDDKELNKPALQLMNEAQDVGICDGIGLSLVGQTGEIVGIGLARSAPAKEKKDYQFMAAAHLLGVYFHETYRNMILGPIKVKMTEREKEILCWAAEGKTDDEVALLLGISSNTVRFHWKKIFLKLEANSRIYAITKAIRLQLIMPSFVRPPPY